MTASQWWYFRLDIAVAQQARMRDQDWASEQRPCFQSKQHNTAHSVTRRRPEEKGKAYLTCSRLAGRVLPGRGAPSESAACCLATTSRL